MPTGSTSYAINSITFVPIVTGVVNWYSNAALTNLIGSGPSLAISNNTLNNTTDVYTYYVILTGSCFGASATDSVTITYSASCCPFAGNYNTLTLCDTGPTTNLFTSLTSANIGGTWLGPSGNPLTNGIFNPATDPIGIYSYIIAANGNCIADTGFVTVNIINISTLSVSPLTTCSVDSPITLTPNLPGGVFSGTNVTSTNIFNPILPGNNSITYTLSGCASTMNLMVFTSPTVLSQTITQPICPGESTGTAIINPTN